MPSCVAHDPGRIPAHIKRLVESPPRTGSGNRDVHRHLLRATNRLRHYLSAEEAIAYLQSCAWPRRLKAGEIEEAIQKAYQTTGAKPCRQTPRAHQKPPRLLPDVNLIEQLVTERISSRNGVDEFLRERSKPIPNSVAEILQILYPTRPLICAAYDWTTALTRPLDWFITPRPDKGGNAPENFQFIVPSPMSTPYWIDQKGRHHARGNANVGPRRFLVTDFDIKAGQPIYAGLIDKWAQAGITIQAATAALIDYLAEAGPLVMVVWSGNISLQAWWYCQGESEALSGQMRGFFESAVILGADPQGWTKCQLFRMPGAQRVNTRHRQAVIYFNPDSIDEKDSQSSQDQNQGQPS